MTQPAGRTDPDDEAPTGPVVRDRRRLDPTTGQVRRTAPGPAPERTTPVSDAQQSTQAADRPAQAPGSAQPPVDGAETTAAGRSDAGTGPEPDAPAQDSPQHEPQDEVAALRALADERLVDLRRLQAEYVNYRRRVDRDRDVAREGGVAGVLEALLPVLDDVQLARQHGDLDGTPFAAIAEKLEAVLGRFGLARYGEAGEPFDPAVHDALLHQHSAEVTGPTVVQVMQPGYTVGERVLRPARVGVADPDPG